jgi:ferritin
MYAEMIGLSGIAAFYKGQAEGERAHADRVLAYVNDRNVIISMAGFSFDDPDINIGTDIVKTFESALIVEQTTTVMLEDMLKTARGERDYLTEQWLLDSSGLLKEQVEEENLYQTILDRINQMRNSLSLAHDLDVWLSERA